MSTKILPTYLDGSALPTSDLRDPCCGSGKQEDVSDERGNELGSTITVRAEKIYNQAKVLRTIVQQASNNPGRLGCSILSVLAGLNQLRSGNVLAGTVATVCGAKELYNLFGADHVTGLQRLLNDIHADVGMIKTLEEANGESYKTVQGNLDLIDQGVGALQSQLSEVAKINTQGLEAIEEKKSESEKLNSQALQAYKLAAQKFESVRKQLGGSRGYYDQCSEYFSQIDAIAKNENPETPLAKKIEQLITAASEASQRCSSGKALLDAAAQNLNSALEELKRANDLKDRATAASSAAVEIAKYALLVGVEKTKYTTECQENVAATKSEMQKVQQRSVQIVELIAELKKDVIAAKNEASGKIGLSEAAIGIGAAAIMGPAVGIMYGAATGVSAMYAFRNGPTLSWAAHKVYNWAMGVQPPAPEPVKEAELIRANFDENSSGYWGYFVQRRASTTVGTLQVNLGDDCVLPFRFNLNERDKIAKEDILTLFEEMNTRVSNGKLSAERCLKILDQLEAETLPRGPQQSAIKGFISKSSPAYAIVSLLRDTCAGL